ncbi:MAG: diguanylate cyclase [Candidatus Competibacteraceae bacterium]|nr:diguanylate cyclase [Candidatus Competibacteraceae bacterium]
MTLTSQHRLSRFSHHLWLTAGLFVALAIAFVLYVHSEKQIDRAHDLRHQSFLLADELRQSSDDLTRMARSYVVTGNPVYQKYYQDILDIREGRQPRPQEYQSIYWDLVLADGQPPRPASPQTIALLELMRQTGFTEQEFQKLADAKASSDALTATEREAMQLAQSTGPEAEADRAKARLMLYGDRYHQAKATIMQPIAEFYRLMDQRTLDAVHTAETRATAFRFLLIGCGIAVLLMLWRVYTALRDTLGGSVDAVYAQIAQIGDGDLSPAIPIKAGLEHTVLGWLSATRAKLNRMDRERQQVAEALRVSETQVRMKLDSILSPNGDLGMLELADVLDIPAIQATMDEFFKLTHIGIGIIDLKGQVLVGTGWQDICVQFHRVQPQTCRNCVESDIALSRGVAPGTFKVYRCKNQMYDIATPIMVGGQHLGNVFLGQFFFDDEPPNREQFRAQARHYGFDEAEYLAALDRAPRWSREKVNTAMTFYTQFAHLFSAVNYSNLQLARSVAERDDLLNALQDSEARFRRAMEEIPVPIMIHDEDDRILQLSKGWTRYSGYTLADLPTLGDWTERAYGARTGSEKDYIDRLFLIDATMNNGEWIVTAKDGSKRIWEFQTTPLGRIHQDKRVLLSLAVDITERKQAEAALRESNELLSLFLQHSPLFTYIKVVTATESRVLKASENFQQMIGIPGSELVGKTMEDLFPAEFAAKITADDWAVVSSGQTLELNEHLNGRTYTTLKFPLAQGGRSLLAGYTIDITERKQIEEALRVSLADVKRHDAQMIVLNRMSDLLLSCETRTEAYEVIANSVGALFAGCAGGLAMREATVSELRVVANWGDAHALPATFPAHDCWALRRGELYEVADLTHRVHCQHFASPPQCAYWCVPLTVRGENLGLLHVSTATALAGEALQEWRILLMKVSGSIKLALSNLKLQEALREQAIHDVLTGLFNRRYLDETLPRELRRCQRSGEPLAVAMLDLDHFKGFNDTYGHEAGDAILRTVGELLWRSLRAGDLACRYGGEELTLILPGATADQARTRLDGLRQAIMQLRLLYQGSELPAITVSIGIAVAGQWETNATALLGRADAALYRAKESGRNRVMIAGA